MNLYFSTKQPEAFIKLFAVFLLCMIVAGHAVGNFEDLQELPPIF